MKTITSLALQKNKRQARQRAALLESQEDAQGKTRSEATETTGCQGIPAMKKQRKQKKIQPIAEHIAVDIGLEKWQQK